MRVVPGVAVACPLLPARRPPGPLAGARADSLRPAEVPAWYDPDEEHEAAGDVLNAFEVGFQRGVEAEAVRSARAMLV